MVDPDVVRRKAQAIDHHASRLRRKLPLDPIALDHDESLRNDVCFDVLQAVQGCIDLAVHVCTHDALGIPDGPASAFSLLARHGIVTDDLALRLTRAAGLRNLLVHQYTDIDSRRLGEEIAGGLDDLEAMAAAVRGHARSSGRA